MKKMLIFLGIALLILSAVPLTSGSQVPVAVVGTSWYSANSTEPVAPGYSYVPLFATFISETSLVNLTISFNFTSSGGGYLSYSYVSGPNKGVRDYYNFPVTSAGREYTIYQLTNISPLAPNGIYSVNLDYSYSYGNVTVKGNVSAQVAILGTISIIPQEAYFGLPGSPVPVTSYESNAPLTVYLENNGDAAATNVTITYIPQEPFSGDRQTKIIPAFPAFDSIPVTFTVNTGAAGFVTYQSIGIEVYGMMHNESFSAKLSAFPYVVGVAADFNTGPNVASQGMKNIPLQFYLEEDSSVPVTNVSVSFTPQYPLSGATQSTLISAIPAFQSVPVTFIVNVTGSQWSSYQNLTLTYNGTSHSVQFKVLVPGYSNISVLNYFTDPPYIYQGEDFVVLKVELINGGNALSPQEMIWLTSNSFGISTQPYSLPGIPAGRIVNLSFLMNASNSVGPADLVLHVNSMQFPLVERILGKGDVEITSGEISVNSGTNGNLFVFNAKNVGNVTLVDLNFHILTPDIFYINIPSSNPLGGLTANNITFSQLVPGQSIQVTFVMDVQSAAVPGTYQSQLVLTYMTNNSSRPFVITHNFNVTIQETPIQRLSSTTWLAYVAVVLAAAIVVIFSALIMRRRRKS